MTAIPIKLEAITPFHYHSLAVPGGTATLAQFLADRVLCYSLQAALGGLWTYPTLPSLDYKRDMMRMPWMGSMLETDTPRLLAPQGRRTNLDTEGGYGEKIQLATGSGNYKTWYTIQEVPPGTVYTGALFGQDPFELAAQATGHQIDSIVVKFGKNRSGLGRVTRGDAAPNVRLNVYTGHVLGYDVNSDPDCAVDLMALYDIQVTKPMPLDAASDIIDRWQRAALNSLS